MTNRFFYIMLLVGLAASTISCNRLKRKAGSIVNRVSQRIDAAKDTFSHKKDQIVDKAFPAYDSGKPDTDANKKRFARHLQVELTEDVKDIYAYGDFLGADYTVLLSFRCDIATIDRIIKTKSMKLTGKTDNYGPFFSPGHLPWWNESQIAKLRPCKVGKENEYWEFLWYDKNTQTAYYEEFSL